MSPLAMKILKYREAVYDALRNVKANAIVSRDQGPLQNCLEDVAS